MTTRIKLRRDTANNWSTNNPILALGEPGLDTDSNSVKYGDGVTAWNSLPYSGEGATENIWLAVGAECNSGHVKISRDGTKWTESFAPMPRYSNSNFKNFWWAKPMGGKVIYNMYIDYLGDETLGWSDNALDYPVAATFTNSPTDTDIDARDWWDVAYINGKFIAVGGFFEEGSTDVERPMFATSDDGKTWTYGTIDQTFITSLVSDADASPTGARISSVAYNGVGYLFALDWDYMFGGSSIAEIPPGFFYVTSLSASLGSANHVAPSQDHNAGLKGLVWNNDHWAAYGHQNVWDRASLFINPNLNPATGNWTEISLNVDAPGAPQLEAFGCYQDVGNTLEAFTAGKIGDDYWEVMGLANGRIMATNDKGVTWIGSVPFNIFNSIDSINYTSSNTQITFDVPSFDGGYYSPQIGERIDIRYGNVPELRGIFWLGAEVGSDGTSRTWTIFSNKALTTPVNSSSWYEDYSTVNGYALITFSRDSAGDDPLTSGGFDQVKIADGKIVAINGAAWASSTDLQQWTLSINTDVETSYSYGTTSLEYGTAGSTNRSSLIYASDSDLNTEVMSFENGIPSADYAWQFTAMGNYVNQLALAENFKVSIGAGISAYGVTTSVTMGMEPTGKWWMGHDFDTGNLYATNTPPSIAAEDFQNPGFEDIVIRTDIGGDDWTWVFGRDGDTYFPGLTIDETTPNNRTGTTPNTLQLGVVDGGRVAITGPMASYSNQDAVELIIAGRDSYYDGNTSTFVGEGGDLYMWAGKGGNGGDIKVDAGISVAANSEGGYVKIRAGEAQGTTSTGGYVLIEAGQGTAANGNVRITTPGHEWKFNANGTTKFPAATAPTHSYGAAGDVAGMVAFDSGYIYYCTADYVGEGTDIWKRVALDATAW